MKTKQICFGILSVMLFVISLHGQINKEYKNNSLRYDKIPPVINNKILSMNKVFYFVTLGGGLAYDFEKKKILM